MDRTNALVERIFRNAGAALELYSIYLGERLGLYRSLAQQGPATSVELAERTGTNERYIREWLEHHAASGLVDVDDVTAAPTVRRYTLPPEHVPVLADPDHVDYHGYKGVELARAARMLPDLVEAYRTGDAPPHQPWEPEGRAEFNRPTYLNLLGKQWLPAIPEIDERLRADPPARVADFACGTGWSSIAMARAYPRITVHGLDLDEDAIAAATRHALEAGLSDRVTYSVANASDASQSGRFDLVTVLEALHDIPRPVDALRSARQLLAPGGSVLILDELVEDEFTAPASELERYHYGWSLMSCLPDAMGDPESAATGAVMRPATLRRYATEAGFQEVQILPFHTSLFRFYRLIP
ncbi:bifunctional 2-polyprenyl-6-hydroxyphenol methylase/3-demethylubiquinol 3-O-methyltransferase UbiG [Kribbella sp. VKM Ac-2566]|uniref:class I SAM-dependent methyltransferase n=1 Tax=Kribbella sp. VKM Ac-2566 TaxID=2512218 RepID=UPI0010645F20|nr:class I SAM-dependent methyltransferase [Kribbella sp. VKM Ac-2566]TDW79416.1 2-polyprenyl-3-methyl-5-hydroxy-6-metoxy-1,4-benzoquinol methylase [Kribbella sp. VKM Ac-2566]